MFVDGDVGKAGGAHEYITRANENGAKEQT